MWNVIHLLDLQDKCCHPFVLVQWYSDVAQGVISLAILPGWLSGYAVDHLNHRAATYSKHSKFHLAHWQIFQRMKFIISMFCSRMNDRTFGLLFMHMHCMCVTITFYACEYVMLITVK